MFRHERAIAGGLTAVALALALWASLGVGAAAAKQGEWASGVPYTTSWDEAIQQCRESGKMLFIYNGWEGRNI